MSYDKDCKENAQGHFVPVGKIKVLDMLRDELVCDVASKFAAQREVLRQIKQNVLDEVAAFVEMSASQYDTKLGGKKGNISLLSFDAKFKIQVQLSDCISFDERLQVAKSLIDECIHDWAPGANENIMALVNDAFQVDKEGKVSTARILGLRRLNIDDIKWLQAMQAIADSMTTVGSKTYIRCYERTTQEDKWQVISLDFAALEVV